MPFVVYNQPKIAAPHLPFVDRQLCVALPAVKRLRTYLPSALLVQHRPQQGDLTRLIAAKTGLDITIVKRIRSKSGFGRKRLALWVQYDGKCYWCNRPTTLTKPTETNLPHSATVEHIHIRSVRLGGTNGPLVLACHQCNSNRNDLGLKLAAGKRVPLEWVARFMSGLDGDGI